MKVVSICPYCAAEIELLTPKDEESFSTSELLAHYETTHPEELAAFQAEHRLGIPYAMQEIRD